METQKKYLVSEGNSKRTYDSSPFYNTMAFRFFLIGFLFLALSGSFFSVVYFSIHPVFHAAVASSDMYATTVGMDILTQGGNAVDAFVAMQVMMTLTESASSGLGGGLFLMYYNAKDNKVYALDGREEAPFNTKNGVMPKNRYGGANVAIPGTVSAISRAHATWGTMDLKSLFQPTIDLARQGYPIDIYEEEQIFKNKDELARYNSTRKIFFNAAGQPLTKGSILKNEDLATTLERLVKVGLQDFYTGDIANDIVEAIKNDPYDPGDMTLDDLKNYRAVFREPIVSSYKGYDIYGMNSPSSGAITIGLALNILENLNYTEDGYGSVLHIKTILDTLSVAWADRDAYLADADWNIVPTQGLLDKQYAKLRSTLINASHAIIKAEPGNPAGAPTPDLFKTKEGMNTASFSILDNFGNVLVCTTTIQNTWGSRYVVPGRGFILNNEITDFSSSGINSIMGGRELRKTALPPDNSTLGGKRPRSSMSPSIIFKDDKPIIGLGSPDGILIIGAVYQVILNLLDFKMDPRQAVDSPRAFSDNDGVWQLEEALINENMRQKVKEYGISLGSNSSIGAVAVVMKDEDGTNFKAAHDPRRGNGLELVINR